MAKRLELVWPHKGEHVLQNPETQKWEFCGSEALLPRPLIEIDAFGDERGKPFNPEKSNLLIKGENLFALQSLIPYYAGQVKLIYIDPPFNIGGDETFIPYDDNYEHSVWLSMIEERLILMKKLLHDSGLIVVHIDYRELHYLKVLLDSVFVRDNFLSMVTLEVKDPAGVGQQSPIFDVCEYLLIYAKDMQIFRSSNKYKAFEEEIHYGKVKGYNKALIKCGEGELVKTIERAHVGTVKIYQVKNYEAERFSKNATVASYHQKFDQIFADYNPDGGMILAIKDEIPEEGLSYIEYTPTRGRNSGKETKVYFLKRRILSWLHNVAEAIEPGVYKKSRKITNNWKVVTATLGAEGNVDLPKGKKPERLIAKIIGSYSTENDLILDAFAGSGTTAAVSHKIKRRWITMEWREDYINDKCLPRLKGVISGEDQTGISQQVDWQGGGGFRFLEVGAPLLVKDAETKLTIINPRYTNGPLVSAVCAIEGFLLTGNRVLHGKNGEHYTHVTEEFVDDALVKKLKRKLKDGQFLTIYAAKGTKRGVHLPKEVRVKRIGQDLIKKYVGGR